MTWSAGFAADSGVTEVALDGGRSFALAVVPVQFVRIIIGPLHQR